MKQLIERIALLMKAYVFVFTGEFGYELLNWQGVVRLFKKVYTEEDDLIICCSRKGLYPLYEFADMYVDISDLPLFRNSVADMYYSEMPESYFNTKEGVKSLKNDEEFVECILGNKNQTYRKKTEEQIFEYVSRIVSGRYPNTELDFVFSSRKEERKGMSFSRGGIYDNLQLDGNCYVKIEQDIKKRDVVEKKLGLNLEEEYFLVQNARRDVVIRSDVNLQSDLLIEELNMLAPVVSLEFDTGRALDSCSKWNKNNNKYVYRCSDFSEQLVLISNAKQCVFFTEGDFRSHNYIPPFAGKNVFSVADKTVFDLPSAPINFWNNNVFKFGGQVIPIMYDCIGFCDRDYCRRLAERIYSEK